MCFGVAETSIFALLHTEMRMDLKNVSNVITACFILHNIAREINLPDFEDVDLDEIMPDAVLAPAADCKLPTQFRNKLTENCFFNTP